MTGAALSEPSRMVLLCGVEPALTLTILLNLY